jgi:hypothetical protein
MIGELDCVALTVDLLKHGLAAGDVGAVVHAYKGGAGFMVEFTTFNGRTVAVTKVSADQIRPLTQNEIHVIATGCVCIWIAWLMERRARSAAG